MVADVQTRGRGRGRRKWESPKGGLWFSVLLRPEISTSRVPLLQFLAANATRQALEDETDIRVLLKWPNDLVLETGKLGGILVESKSIGEKVSFVVIGVGLNVNQRRAQLPVGAASLLLAAGVRFDLRRLLRAVADQMLSRYDDLHEPSRIMKEWWHYCIHRPPKVQVVLEKSTMIGITRGVDEEGLLLLETEDRRVQKLNEGTLRVLDDSTN